MKKLHFSILINAPKAKVWETIVSKETYPVWTEPFSTGSNFTGDWSVGNKMLFVAPNKEGKMEGLISIIEVNLPPDFLSIKHVGLVKNGIEDTESPEAKAWTSAYENYTLKESNGGTDFMVDLDSDEKNAAMFEDLWPKALEKLKSLCE